MVNQTVGDDDNYPTDLLTGLPLPILVRRVDLAKHVQTSDHHMFYRRRHADLEGAVEYDRVHNIFRVVDKLPLDQLGGLAVRVSRVERLPTTVHNNVHKRYPYGPTLPHTRAEKFAVVLKAHTGVLPRECLAVDKGGDIKRQRMLPTDYTYFTAAGLVHPETYRYRRPPNYQQYVLSAFLLGYLATQDLSHVEQDVERFKNASNHMRRISFAKTLLDAAIQTAVDPLVQSYDLYKRQAVVTLPRGSTRQALISHVWQIVEPKTAYAVSLFQKQLRVA